LLIKRDWRIKMIRDREEIYGRFMELVERFREKGATSPNKALTPQELGLPQVV
jgi:hypothetical protein